MNTAGYARSAVGDLAVTGSAARTTREPVRPTPRTIWRPLKVYTAHEDLGVTIARTYGYRCECPCGHRGKLRKTVNAVRADVRQHKAEHDAD